MKRSLLRRMSSTPLPEFEIENLKIEEPQRNDAKTGDKIVYTIRNCSFGMVNLLFLLLIFFLLVFTIICCIQPIDRYRRK